MIYHYIDKYDGYSRPSPKGVDSVSADLKGDLGYGLEDTRPPTSLTLPVPLPKVEVILSKELEPNVVPGRPKAGVLVRLKASARNSKADSQKMEGAAQFFLD